MKALSVLFCFLVSTLFASAAAPTVSAISPSSATTGQTITITGTNFTAITSVTLGGTAVSSFTVVSSTQITAVVGAGASGAIVVTGTGGSGSKTGFFFVTTSRIITDFGGYWSSLTTTPNAVMPDSSHNLLAFSYNNSIYSTGVNDSLLSARSVSFNSGSFRALPIAGITGTNTGTTSTYLALARKVDGSASVAYTPAISSWGVKTVMTDGANGLDLGTGVTNLPATAILTFQINNINPAKVTDAEPDIILTQIAQPVPGNDIYSFIDGTGAIVGSSFTQDMTLLPKFGSYTLDLFNLTPNTPFNTATGYSPFATNTTREMRVVALRLSDFGITAANVANVKALRITPSGNSDYAFVAYNTNAINLPPNVNRDLTNSNTTICSGGTANMEVIASATGSGTLSYQWQESRNAGSSWTSLSNGAPYSGVTTDRMSVVNPSNNWQYRVLVAETGNSNIATSNAFSILVNTPAAPSSVTISGGGSTCLNSPTQLTSSVTGGSNLYYQWQSNAAGAFADIPEANGTVYTPPVTNTGAVSYQLRVNSGSGCGGTLTSSAVAVTVTGVSSVTSASRCDNGTLTLSASATSGSISWYDVETGGSSLFTGNNFTTASLSSNTNYYVAASGCTSALRVPVQAIIYPASVAGTVDGAGVVNKGINSTVLSVSGFNGTVTSWQASTDTFHSVINNLPVTETTLTVNNLTQNTQYRAVTQSNPCTPVYSSIAYMTVTSSLPITASGLKGVKTSNGNELRWTGFSLQQTAQFIIERATDGISYAPIGQISVAANESTKDYTFLDAHPATGRNFYRLREVFLNQGTELSNTVILDWTLQSGGLRIYPNPVVNHHVELSGDKVPEGILELKLINSTGQLVWQKQLNWTGNTSAVNLNSNLAKGVYYLQLTGANGFRSSSSLLIQ